LPAKAISRAPSPASRAPTGSAWAFTLSVLLVDRYSLIFEAEILDQRLLEVLLMNAKAQNVLCRYHYDPLDRLIGATGDKGLQRFYCKSRLVSEIQGLAHRSIFQQGDQLLAQKDQQDNLVETSLMATDQMRTVLQVDKINRTSPFAYSPYGHRPTRSDLLSLLGFNGERTDLTTGNYLLGNGYRAFNPVLKRFHSPDSFSPFGMGGLNAYAYCLGDPINRRDDSGHYSFWKNFKSFFNIRKKPAFSFSPPATPTASRRYTLYERQLDKSVSPDTIVNQYKKARSEGLSLRVPIEKINNPGKLDLIPYPHELRGYRPKTLGSDAVNFVYTQYEELFIGSSGHLALSAVTKSPGVVSAGEITRTGIKSFSITNSSGHFKPAYESLVPVKERLENFGANVALIRHQ
ncbi:RHS repeat-associated core domain-containing protein, partial [Pseudomonas sp. YuFO8]|uniref:RHS repeat-associated core domain-containing protein n=1 Tax=Pseudomonas sp. YuFO8 TaxID=3095361 RepID=UPI003FA74453